MLGAFHEEGDCTGKSIYPGVAVGEDTIWALTMLNSSKVTEWELLMKNGIIIFKMIIVC